MEITKRVLKTWHFVEALVPSEVPGKGETVNESYFIDSKKRNRTRLINLSETPWKKDVVKNHEYQIQFRYYLGCFEHHKLVSFIREAFMNQDEIVNKDNKTLFSFSFLVDDQGNYIKESIFVPFLMYVIKFLAKASEVKYEDMLTPFQSKLKLFEEQAQTIFMNGVTEEALLLIQQEYQQFFHRLDDNSLQYVEIEVMKVGQISNQKNFNSFYISDLELIIKKGENETLRQFVEGVAIEQRLDINENQEYIEDILQPIHLPHGRWPSPVEHRLSLMQQVAVNQIINNNQKISSVNGPPGTGKTTLLKDIFADIAVQRAEKIAQLDTPSQAFTKVKSINLNGRFYPIYLLDSNIKEYSMVVASSNNGAVENISKDLPKRNEVIRSSSDKSKFNHYEESYAVEAEDLSMYKVAAMDLLGSNDEAWGLFSGALGKSDNISTYAWSLFRKKEDGTSFLQQLEQDSKQVDMKSWENAVKEFEDTLNSVKKKKESLQKFHDEYKSIKSSVVLLRELQEQYPELNQQLMDLENEKSHLEQQKQLTEQQIRSLPKLSLLQRVLGKKNTKKIELENELYDIITRLKEEGNKFYIKKAEVEKSKKMIEELKERESAFAKQLDDYKKQGLIIPDEDYWSNTQQAYEFRQLNTIWLTDELNFERGLLFLKAMKIHKMMLAFNYNAIKSTLLLLINRANLDLNDSEHREYLKNMWQTVHLITPLVSTTFASFSSMYKGIAKDFINYLFIDEAGQASPQQSAGAIWRSKNVVVVGDPIQIEPVVTLDQTILGDIKKYFNVSDRYIGMGSSVQTIADTANRYGMTSSYGQWIGIPLWVHRRCLNPMFTVANEIAYDNKMVLGNKGRGKSIWYDCKGSAKNRQFVEEQGELVADHMITLWKKNAGPPNVYIISPFTAVKDGIKRILRAKLKKLGITKEVLNDWLRNSVGTVHTFQGKEADIVYLVTGTDENSDGAANWSCSKPNLLNVAVTRAKKEFYVIGDYQRFSKKPYYSSIVENVDEVKSGSGSAVNAQ